MPVRTIECALSSCSQSFETRHGQQRFCCVAHRDKWHAQQVSAIRAKKRANPEASTEISDLDEMVARVAAQLTRLPKPRPEALLIPRTGRRMGFGPQHQVALFSDYQRGRVIEPEDAGGIGAYNTEIARARLARWRDGVVRFRQSYRFPVDKLWVGALGDDIEGHGQIYPTQSYFLDEHLLEQVVGFVNDMEEVLRFFAAHYRHVEVMKVRGNHGRTGARRQDRPERDNIETIAWLWLRDRLKDVRNLEIQVEQGFFAVVDILGHIFYFTHGEDIRPYSPYAQTGGLNTKLRMNSILGFIIHYFCCAHHHTNFEFEREIGGRFMVNGAFPGPDLYSLKYLHEAALPSQLIFAVHPKWGVTHRTTMTLAQPEEIRDVKVYGRTA